MIGQPQVYETLERMQIPFDYYEHPEAPTIEIAAQFYRGEGTTLCKNLFFRNHKGNRHYLVIMDSRFPMDIHDMEHRLHQGKLSFASPERMMRYLGVKPGSVSLFTPPQRQPRLASDKSRRHVEVHQRGRKPLRSC